MQHIKLLCFEIIIIYLIMNQPSLHPNIIINPPFHNQNHLYANGIPFQHQSKHFQAVGLPQQYRNRPASQSHARPPLQNHTLASMHQQIPIQAHMQFKVHSSGEIALFSQQNKRQQNLAKARVNSSREKQDIDINNLGVASCPNSNAKKVITQASIFSKEEADKDIRCLIQKKLQTQPKLSNFATGIAQRYEKQDQFKLPINNIQTNGYKQIKTDRNMVGRKDCVLNPNMSIPNNLKYMRQSLGAETRDTLAERKQSQSPNLFKNIIISDSIQQKKQLQGNNNQGMKKHMTQANIALISNSPSKPVQPTKPLLQQHSVTLKEQRESDAVIESDTGQTKKKSNFQFFKNIKKKRVSGVFQPQQKSISLNDFELMDKLGKGAFGDVFIAQQKCTGFICVIKKLSKKKILERKLQQQLLREIKIQSYLNHRHLTSVYGFFSEQEYIYIILQLLPDGSLMQVKKKRKIPENQVSAYVLQICLGLKYMHTQNVIHRDIKPQNIFLYQGFAKIGDFGCSIHTNTHRNTQIGSLAYISPEQLKQSTYNQKIDVWSLGVIAYQMLLGVSPFQKDIIKIARKEMAPQLSELKFPANANLSQQAKDFLIRMLDADPERRFGIQDALKHEFILKYINEDEHKLQKVMP